LNSVDFLPKTFLILYPCLENSTTGNAIMAEQQNAQLPTRLVQTAKATPEEIKVLRPEIRIDQEGHYTQTWSKVTAKKRNPNFILSNREEAKLKEKRKRSSDIRRAEKEIIIYDLPTPKLPERTREIGHVMDVAEELRTVHIGNEGFNIQKSEMIDVQVNRLWTYGGPKYTGFIPLKVQFKNKDTAEKIHKRGQGSRFPRQ
jgi:hypothetical protein